MPHRPSRALAVASESLLDDRGVVQAHRLWAFFHADLQTVFERAQPHLTAKAVASEPGLRVALNLLRCISGRSPLERLAFAETSADRAPASPPPGPTASHAFQRDPRWEKVARRLLEHPQLKQDAALLLEQLS